MGWGVPGENAIAVAGLSRDSHKCTIFAYDAGVEMPGLVAPAKRVGFFMFRNTANFFRDDLENLIKIQIMRENGTLTLCIEDDGIPFNPLKAKEIELSCDIEGYNIGGLGLHLVKKLADQLCYERFDGKINVVK